MVITAARMKPELNSELCAPGRFVAMPSIVYRSAAVTIGRTNTALGAFYRRLSARIGKAKAKAVTATARKIAILFYSAMRFGMAYQDPGADHYEQKYRERVVKGLHRRAAKFCFTLQAVEDVS